MPTPTYTPLANITLGSSASSVTFSSISQAYRDLVLVFSGTANMSGASIYLRFNSDSGSNYSIVRMQGNGSTATSYSSTGDTVAIIGNGLTGSTIASANISIMDYSATDKHKTVLSRSNSSSNGTEAATNRWASTSAITSVQVWHDSASFNAGTTLALYGIAA